MWGKILFWWVVIDIGFVLLAVWNKSGRKGGEK